MFDSHFFSMPSRMDYPTVCGLDKTSDGGLELDCVFEALAKGVRQNLKTLVKGEFRGPVLGNLTALLAFARAKDLALNERAVTFFELNQLGESLAHGEFVRVACVHAGDESINRVIEEFLPQPAHNELGDTFLFAIAPARHERFAHHGKLGFSGEKSGCEKARY
jgi:hypothetical protein